MINVDTLDVKGMGETKLREALVAGMGQAGADKFFATWETNVVAPSDVALWASWGVNTVRLPVNYHMLSTAPDTYIESGFQKIDAFVAMCKAHGIYVIVDLHAAPGAQNCEQMSDSPDGVARLWKEPTTYRKWTIDLWQTIASRYRNETAVGGYDIFDEPYDTESSGAFSTGISTLRKMYLDITAAIRAVDPHHVLFFEGTNWSSDDGSTHGFAGLDPAWDPQMAWSFHKYWDANTTSAIQPYLDLRKNTNRPVWNGETGEDNTTGWSGAMIKLLEANKNRLERVDLQEGRPERELLLHRPAVRLEQDGGVPRGFRQGRLGHPALGPHDGDDGAREQRGHEQVHAPVGVAARDLRQVASRPTATRGAPVALRGNPNRARVVRRDAGALECEGRG